MPRPAAPLPILACGLFLAGCASFPDPDPRLATGSQNLPAPALAPIDALIAQADAPVRIAPETGPDLQARAEGLRQRGAALRRAGE